MDDAERGVAVLHRLRDHAERGEVVDALEVDVLSFEFEVDAVEAFGAAVDARDRDLGFLELGANRLDQPVDHSVDGLAFGVDLGAQRFVCLRLEILERQFLELVLHLAHAEAIGDRRVDVERFLRDLDAALFRQMMQRPHVVQAVGELDEDDPDVIDHRQQHLAEVFRLPLFLRRERDRANLGDALDDVRDFGPEQLVDSFGRGQGVLDHVVQQPC
jgi:hypothetical protein